MYDSQAVPIKGGGGATVLKFIHLAKLAFTSACMYIYLEICKLSCIQLVHGNDAQGGAYSQTELKFVQGALEVTTETKTPYLEEDLNVEKQSEHNLEKMQR